MSEFRSRNVEKVGVIGYSEEPSKTETPGYRRVRYLPWVYAVDCSIPTSIRNGLCKTILILNKKTSPKFSYRVSCLSRVHRKGRYVRVRRG